MSNSFFKLKIGWVSQTSQQKVSLFFPEVINRQSRISVLHHVGFVSKSFFDNPFSVFQIEHIFFLGIDSDSDNNFVKQRQCPIDNIDMPVGNRVKRPRKYSS